jgi:peptide deformylase
MITVARKSQTSKPYAFSELEHRPLELRLYPDAVLRDLTEPVELFDKVLKKFVNDMLVFMRRYKGIGLAAPQVGVRKQILVADIGQGPVCVVNPQILIATGGDRMIEGCLSLPEVQVEIYRMTYLEVRGQNPQGKDIHLKTEGLLARVLQHEIDHLNGILICDYDGQTRKG